MDETPKYELNKLYSIRDDEYQVLPGMRASALGDLLKSPLYFHHVHILGNKKKETTALREGKLIHKAILEREEYLDTRFVVPNFKSPMIMSAPKGALIVSRAESTMIEGIYSALMERDSVLAKTIRGIMKSGKAEQMAQWIDDETGVLCKMKADFISDEGILLDFKSTKDCQDFKNSLHQYNYDMQAVHYSLGYQKIAKPKAFLFVACEKKPPFFMRGVRLDQIYVSRGETRRRAAMRIYKYCLDNNKWSDFDFGIQVASPANWLLNADVETEANKFEKLVLDGLTEQELRDYEMRG